MFHKLQYISQGATADIQLSYIQKALDAGCSWIQLRWKDQPEAALLELAYQVKEQCDQYQAALIINDHAAIVNAVDADGLHLGLTDMPVAEARQIIGPGKVIGGTANTMDDIRQRATEQCDYIGLGPFRFTTTKAKLSPVLGTAGYRSVTKAMAIESINIPIYAIGGIQAEDLSDLMDTGIYGIALSGLISHAADAPLLVQQLNQQLYAATTYSR